MDAQLLKYGFRGSLARLRQVVACLKTVDFCDIRDLDGAGDVSSIPALVDFLDGKEMQLIQSVADLVSRQGDERCHKSLMCVSKPTGAICHSFNLA
jgi:hypothetical protein